jgi:hypothetical protein
MLMCCLTQVSSSDDELVPLWPFKPTRSVRLPMIISDPLVFYGMAYHTAGRIGYLHGQDAKTQVIVYQQKAMGILNERLRSLELAVAKRQS